MHSSEAVFQATVGNGTFGPLSIAAAAGEASLVGQNLVDSVLGSGTKSGYNFSLPAGNITAPSSTSAALFWASASPSNTAAVTRTGNRSFAITEDGVMRGAVSDTVATRVIALGMTPLGN